MKTQKSILVKVITLAITMLFLNQQIIWAQDDSTAYDSRAPLVTAKKLDVATFLLPKELGTVKDHFSGNSGKVVVHIQDAHCNYNAQYKIAELIEYFNRTYGIVMINLEGGKGHYDLSPFTNIYSKDTREKVADNFVKEGLINGAEYYASLNPQTVKLWGIEKPAFYFDNLEIYKKSLSYRKEVEEYLKSLEEILTNLKLHIYSEELLGLDKRYSQYKTDNNGFKDYATYLIKKAREKGIEIEQFSNVNLLDKVLALEEDINFEKADNEKYVLVDELQALLSEIEKEELILKVIKFKTNEIDQSKFYDFLIKKAKELNLDLRNFSELLEYADYISIYDKVDNHEVMKELDSLRRKFYEKLCENDKQKELYVLSDRLLLMQNLFNVGLQSEEFESYIRNENEYNIKNFFSFITREAPIYNVVGELKENIDKLDHYRREMTQFYECSFKRDEAFLENLRFSPMNPQAPNPELQTTILITGGFHAENLSRLFKKHNISYVSIMPNFKNDDGYRCPYFERLVGEKSPMIKVIEANIAALAILAELSEMGVETNRQLLKDVAKILEAIEERRDISFPTKDGVITLSATRPNSSGEPLVKETQINGVTVYIIRELNEEGTGDSPKPEIVKPGITRRSFNKGALFFIVAAAIAPVLASCKPVIDLMDSRHKSAPGQSYTVTNKTAQGLYTVRSSTTYYSITAGDVFYRFNRQTGAVLRDDLKQPGTPQEVLPVEIGYKELITSMQKMFDDTADGARGTPDELSIIALKDGFARESNEYVGISYSVTNKYIQHHFVLTSSKAYFNIISSGTNYRFDKETGIIYVNNIGAPGAPAEIRPVDSNYFQYIALMAQLFNDAANGAKGTLDEQRVAEIANQFAAVSGTFSGRLYDAQGYRRWYGAMASQAQYFAGVEKGITILPNGASYQGYVNQYTYNRQDGVIRYKDVSHPWPAQLIDPSSVEYPDWVIMMKNLLDNAYWGVRGTPDEQAVGKILYDFIAETNARVNVIYAVSNPATRKVHQLWSNQAYYDIVTKVPNYGTVSYRFDRNSGNIRVDDSTSTKPQPDVKPYDLNYAQIVTLMVQAFEDAASGAIGTPDEQKAALIKDSVKAESGAYAGTTYGVTNASIQQHFTLMSSRFFFNIISSGTNYKLDRQTGSIYVNNIGAPGLPREIKPTDPNYSGFGGLMVQLFNDAAKGAKGTPDEQAVVKIANDFLSEFNANQGATFDVTGVNQHYTLNSSQAQYIVAHGPYQYAYNRQTGAVSYDDLSAPGSDLPINPSDSRYTGYVDVMSQLFDHAASAAVGTQHEQAAARLRNNFKIESNVYAGTGYTVTALSKLQTYILKTSAAHFNVTTPDAEYEFERGTGAITRYSLTTGSSYPRQIQRYESGYRGFFALMSEAVNNAALAAKGTPDEQAIDTIRRDFMMLTSRYGNHMGKFEEIESIKIDEAGALTGKIRHIDTGKEVNLAEIEQKQALPSEVRAFIESVRRLVQQKPLSKGEEDVMAYILERFEAHLSIEDVPVVVTEGGTKGFFGTGKSGVIAVDKALLENNPISFLHEVMEHIKDIDPAVIGKIESALYSSDTDEYAGMTWLKRHEEKYTREGRLDYFQGARAHYVIRAFTRQVFKENDKELTALIKAEALYGGAIEVIPAVVEMLRKNPTYVLEPSISDEDSSPIVSYLKRTSSKMNKNGHMIVPGSYSITTGELADTINRRIYDDGKEGNFLDGFVRDAAAIPGTRMVIRLALKLQDIDKADTIKRDILDYVRRCLMDKFGLEDVETVLSKIRFIDMSVEDVQYINTEIDLLTDITMVELGRYGEKDGYEGEAPHDLQVRFINLLRLSIENFDNLTRAIGGQDAGKIVKAIFSGFLLKIKKINWNTLRDWKKAQDKVLQAL